MADDGSPLFWIGLAVAAVGLATLAIRHRSTESRPASREPRIPAKSGEAEKQALIDWLGRYRQAYVPYYTWRCAVDAGLDQTGLAKLGLGDAIPDMPVMQIAEAMRGLDPIAFEQAAISVARERGILAGETRLPYSALCDREKEQAREIARALVQVRQSE